MTSESVYSLDEATLKLFELKGKQGGPGIPQVGNANGVKVRRVMQIIRDFANVPFEELRILDLACGEGVYSIEAALRGAEVIALDARTDRMHEGKQAAERLGLSRLRFEQIDIRHVDVDSYGKFDVVFFLGILYHLDAKDIFPVLRNIFSMCRPFVVIDTHIALQPQDETQHDGEIYNGQQVREHADEDSESVRKGRLLASLDNAFSFWFTKDSLFRVLNDIGFTSVCECNVPLEPFKPDHRVTAIARKGERVKVSSYPWVNDRSEEEIRRFLSNSNQTINDRKPKGRPGIKQLAKSMINTALRPFNFEISRRPKS